ncbi:pyridoxal phosphate-dependent aminotransferase [Massiliimalia timonensis]|uniref:pyridoxal phosphate-dependent aminotransferase n=1 Tax=Massiliimalia timonensis TaxID=1987501 RepID=UPI00189F2FB6|nr:histidinol-phosphate transaminase [Massiliimalia timonensis]
MKYDLPQNIKDLTAYDPITGNFKIRLDANESYVPLESLQLQAFADALQEIEFNRYPDSGANRLCEAFATYYGVNRDLVTAFNGSDELLSILISAFLGKNGKLAVFEQDFSMYRLYAQIYRADLEVLPKEDDLSISVDRTIGLLREKGVTMLLFSNPCNPTSLGLSRQDVLRLVTETEALIIVDEAYMDFWDQSLLKSVGKYDNLMILRTCSKAVGLASLRLGFAVAPAKITQVLRAVKSPYNVNTLSQVFGQLVLESAEYLKEAAAEIIENRKWLQAQLQELLAYDEIEDVYPSCTNFVFLKVKGSKQIYQALLERSIAVREMSPYLRITAGSGHENRALIRELTDILKGEAK